MSERVLIVKLDGEGESVREKTLGGGTMCYQLSSSRIAIIGFFLPSGQ